MHADVVSIFEQQQEIGYSSVLVEGEPNCRAYMEGIFSDWQAQGISVILHEKQGGYANNMSSIKGLAMKAENLGVRILSPVTVTGFKRDNGRVAAVETNEGDIACDWVVLGAGPWVRDFWAMLDLPATIDRQRPRRQPLPASHVDLLVPAGGSAARRPQLPDRQPWRDAPGGPRRHRRPPL